MFTLGEPARHRFGTTGTPGSPVGPFPTVAMSVPS